MLLICYALYKVLSMEFLINSHVCSARSPHFMGEDEISERISNLPKITKLVSSGVQMQPHANSKTYFLKHSAELPAPHIHSHQCKEQSWGENEEEESKTD